METHKPLVTHTTEIKSKVMQVQKRFFQTEFHKKEDDERVLEFTFSTENEISRGFYYETLSHDADAVDLNRLRRCGPVLYNHNPDKQIGIVLDAQIKENRGYVRCKFSASKEADEIYQDILGGIRRGVSVGYVVNDVRQTGEVSGLPRIVVNRWEPLEVSICSIPADLDCCISRNVEGAKEIFALGALTKRGREAFFAVRDNKTLEQFKSEIQPKNQTKKDEQEVRTMPSIDITYSPKPTQAPSIVKILRGMLDNQWENADTERSMLEAMDKVSLKQKVHPRECTVPNFFLRTDGVDSGTPPINFDSVKVGWTDAAFLSRDPTGIIDLVGDKSIIGSLNPQRMSGLTDSIEFLKVRDQDTPEPEHYWVGDNDLIQKSGASFYSQEFKPKTLGTYVDFPRSLLLQDTYGVQNYIKNMIREKLATGFEDGFFYGVGTEKIPLGIYKYLHKNSFVQRVDKKGVPCAEACNRILYTTEQGLDWPTIVRMETEIAKKNADEKSMVYVTNPHIKGVLKSKEKSPNTNTYLWSDGLNGYKALTSNFVGKINKTHNEDHMFLGDWSQVVIGEWAGVRMMVDPFTLNRQGALRVTIEKTINLFIHQPESFVLLKIFKDDNSLKAAKAKDEAEFKPQAKPEQKPS